MNDLLFDFFFFFLILSGLTYISLNLTASLLDRPCKIIHKQPPQKQCFVSVSQTSTPSVVCVAPGKSSHNLASPIVAALICTQRVMMMGSMSEDVLM